MKNWLKTLITALLYLGMAPVAALPLPTAKTTSERTITVGLETASNIALIQNATVVSAQTNTSTTTLATTVKALQETLGLTQTAASAISIHTATAEASLVVDILGNDTIASFRLLQSTSTTALLASEPFFARSMAVSQGTAWIWLQQDETDSDSTGAALSVTWDFEDLQLQASPIGSLAYIRDMMNIWQINSEGLLRHDEVGFLSYLINGKVTTRAFDLFNNTDITNWLTANFTNNHDEDASISGFDAAPLDLSIPLAFNGRQELALAISSTHTQISYEAPPRAVVQVEAAAGHRTTGANSDPRVYWDPSSGTLTFDPIPIDLLLGSGNPLTNPDPLAMDPLLGGFLEIGTFTYLDEFDGRHYFSGSDLKLLDSAKNSILTAIAPTLVLEDALYTHQGFNGFAPILLFEQNSKSTSSWLEDFLSYLTIDSLYLPELFIGFDAPFGNKESFNRSFSVPVSALLSFAGPFSGTVPEPSVLWLLCGGLMLLVLWRAQRGQLLQTAVGERRQTRFADGAPEIRVMCIVSRCNV